MIQFENDSSEVGGVEKPWRLGRIGKALTETGAMAKPDLPHSVVGANRHAAEIDAFLKNPLAAEAARTKAGFRGVGRCFMLAHAASRSLHSLHGIASS